MLKMYLEGDSGCAYPETVIRRELPEQHFIRIGATGRDIKNFSYYELAFTDDENELFKMWENNQEIPALRDYGAFGITPEEVVEIYKNKADGLVERWQKKRLVVSEKHLRRKDMIYTGDPCDPKLNCRIFLVSKRFKEATEKESLKGFRFEPCLLLGKEYDKKATVFAAPIEEAVEFADIFQLVITDLTKAPCLVGQNKRVDNHKVFRYEPPYDYKMPTSYFFKPEDLADLDIQIDSGSSWPIFSSRFYQFFLKNKFNGLPKPSFQFQPPVVVPIRTDAYDDSINNGHWDISTIEDYLTNNGK